MKLLNHKNFWFACLTVTVLLIFFTFRPLNSPQYRVIVADGLGYYVYLPAKFIYNDENLKFEWFDEVFNKYYDSHVFEKPTQNFLVQYQNKKINLYYPGQSLLQMPFFFLAHVCAKILNISADGFSLPYQISMGLSALFYTLLGLFFCQKLIFNMTGNNKLSIYVPVIIFFATNLFTYSIFNGCYTHCYSFAFISLSLYFAERFFISPANKLVNLTWLMLCSVTVVALRPMNCILLISLFYFYKSFSLKQIFNSDQWNGLVVFIFVVTLCIVGYNLNIMHTQTGSWIANTYTIGRFYFSQWNHVWDNFFGFQTGILWYTPILLICMIPVAFTFRKPKILFLLAPILSSIILYSLWWYWNIVGRTLVDFSGILVLLLTLVFVSLEANKKLFRLVLILSLINVPFFQLKAYQLRNGILNSNYTYWRYYVKHFFTFRHVDVFPVNPKTVINEQVYFYDFENGKGEQISNKNKWGGNSAAILNSKIEFACSQTYTLPVFFNINGFRKIKASFWFFRDVGMNNVHLVFTYKRNDSTLVYHPFYINETSSAQKWDYKEFGMDFPGNVPADATFVMYFWNPGKMNEAYIDNLKLEFLRTDGSDEITMLDTK